VVEAFLEPDSVVDTVRENIDRSEIVRYRFFDRRNQWGEWKKPVLKPAAGGVSLYLDGVKKDSEIQIQVRTANNTWSSDVINQNLRISVK